MGKKKVNVLIIGSGGREHAIAWKINQSQLLNKLYVAPGNSGTHNIAKNLNINIDNYGELKNSIVKNNISLLIIGPEVPLVRGLHDKLADDDDLGGLKVIGPKKEGAMLEGSKLFAKNFMQKHNIPTANFKSFNATNILAAKKYLEQNQPPFVIKADGLAAGKGVFICQELSHASKIIDEIVIDGKFGVSGNNIVIEQFLDGPELSVFILTDGNNYKLLPSAKDYKRVGEGDTGLNTGGMGAISPVPFLNDSFMQKIKDRIIAPTLMGLKKEKIEYSGFMFFGLIKVNGNPFVIEYNVRLGDPETQVIMPRIKSDLLCLLLKMSAGKMFAQSQLDISSQAAASVIIASKGYPESYTTGHRLRGIEIVEDCSIFHAGLKLLNKEYLTSGGRVLAITACSKNLSSAVQKSYEGVGKIQFENIYFRKDIGEDMIK